MSKAKNLLELMYPDALWFEEVFRFYKKASELEVKEFEILVKRNKKNSALALIKRVLGL